MANLKQASAFDADEAELRAIREGVSSANSGAYNERLSQETLDIGNDDFGRGPFAIPSWELKDAGQTSVVGPTLEVLKTRRSILGDLYPFRLSGSEISYNPKDRSIYEFLLATSEAVTHSGGKYRRLIRQFERLAALLVAAYTGPDATSCRFGWPSEEFFERAPTTFDPRVQWMKKSCEFDDDDWCLSRSKHARKSLSNANDGKIDFVIRRRLVDRRPGCVTIVGQCGCGRSDVQEGSTKHRDLTHDWLGVLFDRTTTPRPLVVFASSQHIPSDDLLSQMQQSGQTLVFDRLRLVRLAERHKEAIPERGYKFMQLLTKFVKENPPKT